MLQDRPPPNLRLCFTLIGVELVLIEARALRPVHFVHFERRTAQQRGTGGRWRGIVLGDLLAEHVVRLRGTPRLWPWT